ncbi:MAG: PIN domain-containing protein, partial [Gammaproteobacteria bacterium]
MDSLDTNILIRYYTDDDPVQSPLAVRLLEERAPLFVPLTVVQELFWVLESHCELPKARLLK